MTTDENGPPRTQPALRTLQVNQRELLVGGDRVDHGLRDGFPTLRSAIEWRQRAIARTMGNLSEKFPTADLLRDRTLATALVVGPERERLADDPLDPRVARGYRRLLERRRVRPACNSAYNRLRRQAGEYLQDSDVAPEKVDPRQQDHVAMRPTLERKDREQAAALDRLWGGFDGEDELLDWIHDLDEPSNGAIPSGLAAQLCRDETARRYLLGDDLEGADIERARRWREHFAAVVILPAFVRGIRRLEGGELVEQQSSGLNAPHG